MRPWPPKDLRDALESGGVDVDRDPLAAELVRSERLYRKWGWVPILGSAFRQQFRHAHESFVFDFSLRAQRRRDADRGVERR